MNVLNVQHLSTMLMLVCMWVIGELEFLGKETCARKLKDFWRDGDVNVLAEILELAQFPELLPAEQ